MRIKIWIASALVFLGLASTPARAANPFSLDWRFSNYPNSCVAPGLVGNTGFFYVNDLDIPTYTVANSLVWGANGAFQQDHRAAFSGTLLRTGINEIYWGFQIVGLPPCALSDHTVRLRGPMVNRLLFQLQGVGNQWEGATDINLTLREIDPNLADSLENLKRALKDAMDQLHALGPDADADLAALEALEAELDELLDKGLDQITPEELDALLAQFDGVPQAVRDALVKYLEDLQADIDELRNEIQRIAAVFEQNAASVDGVGDGAPGFNPSDPHGFDPIDSGDIPPIDIPAVLGDAPWSPTYDPYAKYADDVIASLTPTVSGNVVVQRATFLSIHAAWRYNTRALEMILQRRVTVTVSEWAAFLNAKGRVVDFVKRYIDDDGWLRDAPISPQLRALFLFLKDMDVVYRLKQRAEALQLEINQWTGPLTEQQRAILDFFLVYDEIIRERMAQEAPEETEDGFWDFARDALDVAISLTPVGDLLDACRAITGKADCWKGEQLTFEERVASGLGVVVGSGAAWKAAASKFGGPALGIVRKVGDVLDEIVPIRPVSNVIPKRLKGGAIEYTHANGLVVRYNRKGFPDFRPFTIVGPKGKCDLRIKLSGVRTTDFRLADEAAGFTAANPRPPNTTWHHHEDMGRMILVPTPVNNSFPHTGGVAIWQKVYGDTYR